MSMPTTSPRTAPMRLATCPSAPGRSGNHMRITNVATISNVGARCEPFVSTGRREDEDSPPLQVATVTSCVSHGSVDRPVKPSGTVRPHMGRQLTPRGQQRRDQLIELATACFAERGYHDTSVADLVAGLGVGKGVFYWYFESKEQLFVEILREAQLDLRRAQRAAIGDERDPVRRIELGIRSTLAWIEQHPHHDDLIRLAARFLPGRGASAGAVADAAVAFCLGGLLGGDSVR